MKKTSYLESEETFKFITAHWLLWIIDVPSDFELLATLAPGVKKADRDLQRKHGVSKGTVLQIFNLIEKESDEDNAIKFLARAFNVYAQMEELVMECMESMESNDKFIGL